MKTKHTYTDAELSQAANADLLADAIAAEQQAENGPYYMDNVGRSERVLCVTDEQKATARAELLAYAAECRAKVTNA